VPRLRGSGGGARLSGSSAKRSLALVLRDVSRRAHWRVTMDEVKYSDITKRILAASFEVHKYLGNGFQEVVYQRALAYELTKAGLEMHWLSTKRHVTGSAKAWPSSLRTRRRAPRSASPTAPCGSSASTRCTRRASGRPWRSSSPISTWRRTGPGARPGRHRGRGEGHQRGPPRPDQRVRHGSVVSFRSVSLSFTSEGSGSRTLQTLMSNLCRALRAQRIASSLSHRSCPGPLMSLISLMSHIVIPRGLGQPLGPPHRVPRAQDPGPRISDIAPCAALSFAFAATANRYPSGSTTGSRRCRTHSQHPGRRSAPGTRSGMQNWTWSTYHENCSSLDNDNRTEVAARREYTWKHCDPSVIRVSCGRNYSGWP
jgi:hypothetical protein